MAKSTTQNVIGSTIDSTQPRAKELLADVLADLPRQMKASESWRIVIQNGSISIDIKLAAPDAVN